MEYPEEFSSLLDLPLLVGWFASNCHWKGNRPKPAKLHCIPLGIENRYLDPIGSAPEVYFEWMERRHTVQPTRMLLVAFRNHLEKPLRFAAVEALQAKDWITVVEHSLHEPGPLTRESYLRELQDHHFAACPPGHGFDTHRLYEVLMAGIYPIVISGHMDSMYEDLPILVVKRWTDVTKELLEATRKQFQSRARWRTEKMFFPYWQRLILEAVTKPAIDKEAARAEERLGEGEGAGAGEGRRERGYQRHPEDVLVSLFFRVPRCVEGTKSELSVAASGLMQGVRYRLNLLVRREGSIIHEEESAVTWSPEGTVFQHILPSFRAGSHELRVTLLDSAADAEDEALLASMVQRLDVRTKKMSFFYLGVTHSSTKDNKLQSAIQTWAGPLNVVWYSDKPGPGVSHVVSHPDGNSYRHITWRMLLIWKHVATHYPNYDWYVRVWDDNYIIQDTFEALADFYQPDDLVEIGRLALYDGHTFVGGGASSLLSRGAMRVWSEGIEECTEMLSGLRGLRCAFYCEDVMISRCRSKMGIRFERGWGLYSHGPAHQREMNISYNDIACRREGIFQHGDQVQSVPRSFHYLDSADMFAIHRALTSTPCLAPESSVDEQDRSLRSSSDNERVSFVSGGHVPIIDSVMYNGEPMASTRLALLNTSVDRFYITESWSTFTAKRKTSLFKDIHADVFAPYDGKIVWCIHDFDEKLQDKIKF